jgi:hypothetical protein
MTADKEINPKIIYWLTFCGVAVNIVCLVVFLEGVSTSGDTGITMWAIFLFDFFLVSVSLHMLLLVLALVQSFISTKHAFKWVYVYILITVIGFVAIAAKYGALDDWFASSAEQPQLTASEILMQRAFNTATSADIAKEQQALAQGLDANSGFHQ